jgi:SAM-dependent methyltransferase
MQSVHSFDIFDTLLARSVQLPTDIFDIIEKKMPYPNFKSLRIQAQDHSNHTIENIYYHFKLLTNESDESIRKIREFELKTEMENTIPIVSNIAKIKNGDIFVSDMYLSHDEIIQLLNYHNINTNIPLYVSPSGKSSGYMWEKLIQTYNIINHTGDNYYSDITMASHFGITGVYTQIHRFSNLETKLIDPYHDLCTFLRRFRLMNPYDETTIEYKLYDNQIQYNIPLLLFMCRKVANILACENRTKVLFLSRDGCFIYKLFSFLYPEYNSYYVYSSRIINQNYTNSYVDYLKQIYNKDDCLLFDLHGSFESGRKLYVETFGDLPRIFIFDLSKECNYYHGITHITKYCSLIEIFNQDMNGSLIDFKHNGPIHMPTETPLKYIKVMHDTIDQFISYICNKTIITNCAIFENDDFWKDYYVNVVKQIDIICNNISGHDANTLTALANKYNSDKGNTYKCAHHYTLKYQEIISQILQEKVICQNYENMKLLEIGLNRDDTNSIPSLMMWNDYLNKNIHITGFDIDPNFEKFIGRNENIEIVIGDQSNEDDLAKLKTKNYDIIIDDGSHISEHQQISFKELWESVKPGGYYVIEDLHYQPIEETCVKTKYLFEQWKTENWIESEYIKNENIQKIQREIDSIEFYNSQSTLWGEKVNNALVYIKKNIL